MRYVRLCETTKDKGTLIPIDEDVNKYITKDIDYYLSVFHYEDKHLERIKANDGSVAGINDVTTDRLYFDFDHAIDVDKAKNDAIMLVNRLVKDIPEDNLQIYFSGGKGFGIEVKTTEKLQPHEVKNLAMSLGKDLKTLDTQIYNASRILRIPGTKHPKTNLYKIPLTRQELEDLDLGQIKSKASNPKQIDTSFTARWKEPVHIPDNVLTLKGVGTTPFVGATELKTDTSEFNQEKAPKWLDKAKYALQEGFFENGERHHALMILASTYKNQGFNQDIVFSMLQTVARKQAARFNDTPYTDREIKTEIINSVFSPLWNNGQYSLEDPLLQKIRLQLNIPWFEDKPKVIVDINSKFRDYVKNIDKNRIKTGLPGRLDDTLYLTVGSNVGILGAPGSGKSSIALEILSNTSKAGIKSVFASLDMTSTRIYEKIMYRLTGLSRHQLYKKVQAGEDADHIQKVKEEFGNVFFFDKSSPSVKDIKEYVLRCQDQTGEKVKLLMIDYFERISSDVSDDTASSKKVAGELQDLVNDLDICLITLVQPNKMSGDMSHPILSYTNIKGSSFLAQSFRQIMAVYREGFNPVSSGNDKYLTINILKNDLGEAGTFDFRWEGNTGRVHELKGGDLISLRNLRKGIQEAKLKEQGILIDEQY